MYKLDYNWGEKYSYVQLPEEVQKLAFERFKSHEEEKDETKEDWYIPWKDKEIEEILKSEYEYFCEWDGVTQSYSWEMF